MQERREMYDVEPHTKEQWISVLVEIVSLYQFLYTSTWPQKICTTMLASVPAALIEYTGTFFRPFSLILTRFIVKDTQLIRQVQNMVYSVQMEAMTWCHMVMSKYLSPVNKSYTTYIRKLLFLEPLPSYFSNEVNMNTYADLLFLTIC